MRAAHVAVGGSSRGRRYATQQINQAYAMMVASQFQGYCRDLHSESVDHFVTHLTGTTPPLPISFQHVVRASLIDGRKLDGGNANPGNIGADFGRLGIDLWPAVRALHLWNVRRQARLEDLNVWRNAIAHQDFNPAKLSGRSEVQLKDVAQWRSACHALVQMLDRALADHLQAVLGTRPWV